MPLRFVDLRTKEKSIEIILKKNVENILNRIFT